MDDPRFSRMYARAFAKQTSSTLRGWERSLRRRRTPLRWLAFVLFLFGLGFGYYAHIQGRFGRLKNELKATPQEAPPLLVGGQEPLTLERAPLNDGSSPEFLSATFLPGRGMGLLQLTAMIPGRGATSLLQSPSLDSLTSAEPAAASADHSADHPGAISPAPFSLELPWAGSIPGTPFAHGLEAEWRGHTLQLPLTSSQGESAVSQGGLLRLQPSESIDHDVMPDGGSAQAHFQVKNFNGAWPSETQVVITALLSSRSLDLRITAHNVGHEPEPMGIGWIPSIILPSLARSAATLHIPSTMLEQMKDGRATGKFLDVTGSPLDFSARTGKRLGDTALDATFAQLRTGFLDNGPVLELRDVNSGVGLRMTSLSPQIQAVHVSTDPSNNTITFGFASNLDDPFSRVWHPDGLAPIPVLLPGQTAQWHVRLELMALTPTNTAPL